MKIGLIGNPNTGKSSIFNMLTGLRQHVGNFPGVTVDKRIGNLQIGDTKHKLIDFPGTYSIYPRSKDEQVVYKSLTNPASADYPDALIVVVDASNLERNLLFFSQIYDLGFPTMMVLNMTDVAERKQILINREVLQDAFPDAAIVDTNARVKVGKDRLLKAIQQLNSRKEAHHFSEYKLAPMEDESAQEAETEKRFVAIKELMTRVESLKEKKESRSNKLDRLVVHPIMGYLIFAAVLIVIFQFIYSFAAIPMDLIDSGFIWLSEVLSDSLPKGVLSDLLTQGIVPGIGGVIIFVPQIALLFFFIGILEESGYLARVVFIMDRIMRPLGLNGKSVVPMMSSVACAIPGVMAARTISDWKERTITILISPLMSCSARIPVYTLLIALVIPNQKILGFMNLQGLVLFGLYALGLITALLMALLLKYLIKTREKGFLLLEMPDYKLPLLSTLGFIVWEKVKVFVLDAGKIILAISIVLWAMASYGPGDQMDSARSEALRLTDKTEMSAEERQQFVASSELEASYIGHLGKFIEPVIKPLGYDWKIGISLITSFAAREVFVGSMATIYAVQDDGETNAPLIEKMRNERNAAGEPVYSFASGLSLMIFYVYAMMCMATIAVVKRETKSWKWPLIQLTYMGVLAYGAAFITYNLAL